MLLQLHLAPGLSASISRIYSLPLQGCQGFRPRLLQPEQLPLTLDRVLQGSAACQDIQASHPLAQAQAFEV